MNQAVMDTSSSATDIDAVRINGERGFDAVDLFAQIAPQPQSGDCHVPLS